MSLSEDAVRGYQWSEPVATRDAPKYVTSIRDWQREAAEEMTRVAAHWRAIARQFGPYYRVVGFVDFPIVVPAWLVEMASAEDRLELLSHDPLSDTYTYRWKG